MDPGRPDLLRVDGERPSAVDRNEAYSDLCEPIAGPFASEHNQQGLFYSKNRCSSRNPGAGDSGQAVRHSAACVLSLQRSCMTEQSRDHELDRLLRAEIGGLQMDVGMLWWLIR
jgi:hypothetical protein